MALPASAQSLFLLGQDLRSGLSDLGNQSLNNARFNLEKAATEYKMNDPRQQVSRQVAQNQLDEFNTPLRASMLVRDVNGVGHWLWKNGDDSETSGEREPSMIQKFAKMWDAKLVTDESDPRRGQFITKDGKPITLGDLHQNSPRVQAFIKANTGLDHKLQDVTDRAQRNLLSGKIDQKEFASIMSNVEKIKSSPALQMQIAQKQIDYLSQFTNQGNPLFQSEITRGLGRWQKKYDSAAAALAKERETERKEAFELKKLREEEAGRNKRDNARNIIEIEKMFSAERIANAKAEKKAKEGKKRTYADMLNEQKYDAYKAYLNNEATPEQIRVFGLDKDVYLAQAMKLVNDEQAAAFDDERLAPEDAIERIIMLANQMREAANPTENPNDRDNIRRLLYK